MPEVYALCDPVSGVPRYIGWAMSAKKRLTAHLHNARAGKLDNHVHRWILTLSEDPELRILGEFDSPEATKRAEIEFILWANTAGCDLTNMTRGGDGGITSEWTQERRDSESARLKALWQDPAYREDVIKKISKPKASNEGYIIAAANRDPEVYKKVADKLRGVPKTPEHCEAIRVARTGRPSNHPYIECECGMITTPGAMGRHHSKTGHKLREDAQDEA